ncbi:MAG: VWA domain-containing protein [Lachnospiraceae bacterium]|nr:VWA domain-containing protein [Lachnospiraceae bacterium]
MSIDIARPLALLLIPVFGVLLAFSFRFLKTRSGSRKITYIVVRSIVALLLILALSGINIKLKDKYTATVFLLDVSDSVKNSRSEMISFVNESIKSKHKYDSVAVVAFGDGSAVEQFLSQTPAFSEFQSTITKTATNIENAVLTGLSMIPEGYAGRIVLLTDGAENAGTLKNTAASVVAKKCLVEVKTFDSTDDQEVYVSNLKVPSDAGVGESFVITVDIESNVVTNATINLYSGRTLKGRREVALTPGVNTFAFTDTWTEEGLKTYKVLLEAEKDTVSVNNEYLAYTTISIAKPVLILEGKAGQSKEFVKILDSLNLPYEVRQPVTAPDSLSEMNEFSSIVFVDVYAKDLRTGFVENLESYVRDFGGGFICTGGKNSYALGGYTGTDIEKVLPVSMEPTGENEIPTIAMLMVIDHSGSMSDGFGTVTSLDLAKEAAIAALDNLRPTDYVGVIAFDDSYEKVVPLRKADDPIGIANQIGTIEIAGGTSIYPALEAAAKEIRKCQAPVKHILLLTDGQDGYEFNNYLRLIEQVNSESISISTVSIGDASNDTLLSALAEECGGRYYHTDANSDLPRIFAQEVFLSVNSYIVNRTFTPLYSSDKLINDVCRDGLPEMLGYIATSAKPRATQLFVSDSSEPILSTWQYGLGKTVAWTTDVTNNWTANYAGWDNYRDLWHNLFEFVTTRDLTEGAYTEVSQEGSVAKVSFVTENFSSGSRVVATVIDDLGNAKELTLDPVTPGTYRTQFEMSERGVYSINVKQYDNDEITASINTAAIMQYSLEYRFNDISAALPEFLKMTGGNSILTAAEVFNEDLDLVKKQRDLSTALLIAAVVMFMIDIAVRRFRFDPAAFFARKPKPVPAPEELSEKDLKKAEKRAAQEAKALEKKAAKAAKRADSKDKPDDKDKRDNDRKNGPAAQPQQRLNTAELMRNLRR